METTPNTTEVPTPNTPNPEHLKVRSNQQHGPFVDQTLDQAETWLRERGFEPTGDRQSSGLSATLQVWKNPHTGQKANLSHYTADKKNCPVDKTKIGFFLVKPPKRRTQEEKRRDDQRNQVLYD